MRTGTDLKLLQSLPLSTKIAWSIDKILNGVSDAESQGRPAHVNFSGGVDSVVLRSLVTMAGLRLPVVFSNTGMEFTQICRFAKKYADIVVRPEVSFADVVKLCGYPAISKDQARYLHDVQNPTTANEATVRLRLTGMRADGSRGSSRSMLAKRYHSLIDGPSIGDGCCSYLKEKPLDKYASSNNGSVPLIGVQAEESGRRTKDWINFGCIGTSKKHPTISPMMIWRKTDVLEFIRKHSLDYCQEIYGDIIRDRSGNFVTTKETRTGCAGCLFGCYHDPERFVRLRDIDRPKWEYLLDVGARDVLLALGLPTGEK